MTEPLTDEAIRRIRDWSADEQARQLATEVLALRAALAEAVALLNLLDGDPITHAIPFGRMRRAWLAKHGGAK